MVSCHLCLGGGIPLPGRGIVGKHQSAQSKTTARSKWFFPLRSRGLVHYSDHICILFSKNGTKRTKKTWMQNTALKHNFRPLISLLRAMLETKRKGSVQSFVLQSVYLSVHLPNCPLNENDFLPCLPWLTMRKCVHFWDQFSKLPHSWQLG